MIVTQQAAVHLGNDYLDPLHSTKNQPPRTVKQLFDETSKLVREQTQIQGISLIDWQENSWKRTTLLTERAVQLSTAKAYVFSDSVKYMGRISESPVSARKEKIENVEKGSNRRRADEVRVEKYPRIHYIADSRRDPEHDD